MDEAIIASWNAVVKPDDEVFFGGDFGINPKTILDKSLVSRLNGIKHAAAIGNHDYGFKELHQKKNVEQITKLYEDAGWTTVSVQAHITLKDGKQVTMTHLPTSNEEDTRYSGFKIQNDPNRFYINGHLHGHWKKKLNMVDIGYDINLRPISEDEIIELFNSKEEVIPTRLTEKYKANNLFLQPFEAEVKKKYVQKSIKEHLVLYNYNDLCTYDCAWNDVTIWSRGIIFNRNTGAIVAAPFSKFFNYAELERTPNKNIEGYDQLNKIKEQLFKNIQNNVPYEVYEKMDGSLGIIYHDNGQWHVATRGSFNSEQAKEAEKMLKDYDMHLIDNDLTLLCEIIYPENKIVIDYKDQRKLVLLAANHRVKQTELSRFEIENLSTLTGMPICKKYGYTIEQMMELKKTLSKDDEGFVIRFEDGLRVKIKGEEYLKVHKMISSVSPLSFWETMKNGRCNVSYLKELPEEFRQEAEDIIKKLESNYYFIKIAAYMDFVKVMNDCDKTFSANEIRKFIGLNMKKSNAGHMFFSIFDCDGERLDKSIMKMIRPDGNVL